MDIIERQTDFSDLEDIWVRDTCLAILGRCRRSPCVTAIQKVRTLWEKDPDSHERAHLEARLVTTESLTEVAEKCNMSHDEVIAYHQVFFNVRSFRKAVDWFHVEVLGVLNKSPMGLGVLWKRTAYGAPSQLLDHVIAATHRGISSKEMLASISTAEEYKAMECSLYAQHWIEMNLASTNNDFAQLVRDTQKLRKLRSKFAGFATVVSGMDQVLEKYLLALPRLERKARVQPLIEEAEARVRARVGQPSKKATPQSERLPAEELLAKLDKPKKGRRKSKANI